MDSRLVLTEKQKELVKQLKNLFKEMEKAKLGIIADAEDMFFNGFLFYNKSEVLQVDNYDSFYTHDEYELSDSGDTVFYAPEYDEFEKLKVITDAQADANYWLSFLLPNNEESDAAINKIEKANQLKPLLKQKDQLESRLQQYNDAVLEIVNNIKTLENKGVSQEIINEEKERNEVNITQIEELKKEIEKLNSEIEAIKDN